MIWPINDLAVATWGGNCKLLEKFQWSLSYVYVAISSSQRKTFWLAPLYPVSTYWERFKNPVRVELKQSEDDLLIVSVVTKYGSGDN